MARKPLNLNNNFNFDGTGTGASVEPNAKKIEDNFVELYAGAATGSLAWGIDASEQMEPEDTSVWVTNDAKATIPAATLQVGDRIRIRGWGRVTGQNGSNTIETMVTLDGAVTIAAVAAHDPATGDFHKWEADIFVEALEPSPVFQISGESWRTGGSPVPTFVVDSGLNPAFPIPVAVMQRWSADNATNRFRLLELMAEVIRP